MVKIAATLLRRTTSLFVDAVPETTAPSTTLEAVEVALLDLGYILSPVLREKLESCSEARLGSIIQWAQNTIEDEIGANRPHVPLFRRFPHSTPRSTEALLFQRVVAWMLQSPEQPCFMCGSVGTVSALKNCGHLICSNCWDGRDYSGCPICHRRLDLSDPFFKPDAPLEDVEPNDPVTLQRLNFGEDLLTATKGLFGQLLSRSTPLSTQDKDDLLVILTEFGNTVLDWLPAAIPVKENRAIVFGTLLKEGSPLEPVLLAAAPYMETATDILRLLSVIQGGSEDFLVAPGYLKPFPRALRRWVLQQLSGLKLHLVIEDMQRHSPLWKRFSKGLRPMEFYKQFSSAAIAFAVIHQTRLNPATPLGSALVKAAQQNAYCLSLGQGKIIYRTWASRLEESLLKARLEDALSLLSQRPGELFRRLDHLLRLILDNQPELLSQLKAVVQVSVDRAASAMLLTVIAHLRCRESSLPRRVFFPRGKVLTPWSTLDGRLLLPEEITSDLIAIMEAELLRRVVALPPVGYAQIDVGLKDILIPFNEKTSAKSLVTVPRGSKIHVPNGKILRLFLHWMEDQDRVDLDLSVAFFSANWEYIGLCDFTSFRYEDAAVHSGDLTSAPPPLGASEFIDLDLEKLRAKGIRYVSQVILSYNSVVFDALPDAFAGFMLRDNDDGQPFDPKTVAQRFDLHGEACLAVPMILDLADDGVSARWVDVKSTVRGSFHSVRRYTRKLAQMGHAMTTYFEVGDRPSMWELACLHAAGRTTQVYLCDRDTGVVSLFEKGQDEIPLEFYDRLLQQKTPSLINSTLPEGTPGLITTLCCDEEVHAGSIVYSLYGGTGTTEAVDRVAAGDLISFLMPVKPEFQSSTSV